MTESITIPTIDKTKKSIENYKWLRQKGLEYIEDLCGKIWTDYNIHDPGITILEMLCYAITDLGYRTKFPFQDIIAEKKDNALKMHKHFLTALKVLPCRPVSKNDYRKLLIDLKGVKNAWLEETKNEVPVFLNLSTSELSNEKPENYPYKEIELKGLYKVTIEFEENVNPEEKAGIIENALDRLHKNRNLCEDFVSITGIEQQEFILCAELELTPEADIEKVEAQIFHDVQKFLTPPIRSYTLKEMFDKGKTAEQIFEGPLYKDSVNIFDHGFIDDNELLKAGLCKEINLSDIIQVIMKIKGVLAVKDLIIRSTDDESPVVTDRWQIKVKESHKPWINFKNSRIVHYKDMLSFRADQEKVESELNKLNQAGFIEYESARIDDLQIPLGDYREIDDYISITNGFPITYGIGKLGLLKSESEKRKAQAKQLKAYLLFFDQILANFFAQLSKVKDLFSIDENITQTYSSQVIEEVKDIKDLYKDFTSLEKDLQDITENKSLFIKRRNQFLDHLLARFNERFTDYVLLMYSLHGEATTEEDLIYDKIKFLQEYPKISGERGLGFNYLDKGNLWDTYNVSGLQHRVARLTGIVNYKRRNLAKITYDIYEEKDEDNKIEYRFRVIDKKNNKILISSSTKYLNKDEAVKEMSLAVNLSFEYKNYDKKTTIDERYYFNLINEEGEVIARRIEYFKTKEKRDEAINYLRRFMLEKYGTEGMFIVEHILLRNKKEGDPLMPVCVDKDIPDCPDSDPYSFRISVVLPAWEKRFSYMHFRGFFEKTLRLETPAHILPKICWVNEVQMSEFEEKYNIWLEKNAQFPHGSNQLKKATSKLIEILSKLKNIYPKGTLHDCIEGADTNPIILGSTNIGSMNLK